ncbi:MAG: alpha/beta fold hydrolase [Pseudomonadota bacterium]
MSQEYAAEGRYAAIDVRPAESPHLLDTMLEGVRLMSEATLLGMSWPCLRRLGLRQMGAHKPHDTPVMVLPGFMGGDASTMALRRYLGELGFRAHPWLLGTNDGTERIQSELLKRFLRLRQNYGQPIALVGHSLGGVFARELARQFPSDVTQVITLGSPFGISDSGSVNQLVRVLFERVSGDSVDEKRARMLSHRPAEPVGVPCTSIFSKRDGVVHWRTCLERETPVTQNLEVWGSHCGLIANPSVLHAVVDRLSLGQNSWVPFEADSGARVMYPRDQKIYA